MDNTVYSSSTLLFTYLLIFSCWI